MGFGDLVVGYGGLRFRVWIWILGHGVWELTFGFRGLGFGVWGLRFFGMGFWGLSFENSCDSPAHSLAARCFPCSADIGICMNFGFTVYCSGYEEVGAGLQVLGQGVYDRTV